MIIKQGVSCKVFFGEGTELSLSEVFVHCLN